MLSLPFHYEEKEYYTLVRVMERLNNQFELRFTIMNAELQSKLCGDDKFIVKDGKLHIDVPSKAMAIAKLKIKIAEAVNNYFEKHPLVNGNPALRSA